MGRYFMKFSYLGTQYRGMQKNVITNPSIMLNDPDTIQGALETAFTSIIPQCIKPPKMHCTSRTDVGVHALCNTGHIDLYNKYNAIYNPEAILTHVNRYMLKSNHDIRLLEFVPMQPNFHARRLVQSRTYIYRFMLGKNEEYHKTPIVERLYCHKLSSHNFDIERLRNGLKLFTGIHNFQTFSAKKKSKSPIKYVKQIDLLTLEKGQSSMPCDVLSQNFDFWNIVCSARSFLYKQVRRIVTTLFALATGQITEKDITILLQVPGHHNWPTELKIAPGSGLFLANVDYDQQELDEYKIQYKTCSYPNTVIPVEQDEVYVNKNINKVAIL